jgi:hypothetical protein
MLSNALSILDDAKNAYKFLKNNWKNLFTNKSNFVIIYS